MSSDRPCGPGRGNQTVSDVSVNSAASLYTPRKCSEPPGRSCPETRGPNVLESQLIDLVVATLKQPEVALALVGP